MSHNPNTPHAFPLSNHPHWSTQFDLAAWGIEDVAFIKPVHTDDGEGYGIFAADGTELAVVDTRDHATITVRQNDLEPLSVH